MAAPPRRLALGDSGTNAPEAWRWGGPKTPAVDVLLMLYAASEAGIDDLYASAAAGFDAGGVEQIGEPLRSMTVVDEATQCVKEHFGFCDALSQPFIEGLEKPAPDFLTVKTGEIILGYPNEYGKYTERPLVPAEQDPSTILPDDVGGSPAHDLGRVGRPESIAPEVLRALLAAGFVPVVSPVGAGPSGEALNVNADEAALAIAQALDAESLVYLSDVDGVCLDDSALRGLTEDVALSRIADGTIAGGMALKVRTALAACAAGIPEVVIAGRARLLGGFPGTAIQAAGGVA